MEINFTKTVLFDGENAVKTDYWANLSNITQRLVGVYDCLKLGEPKLFFCVVTAE